MLDKEPTLLDIEKIFSTAMIEEGKDWKTKMEEAETILEIKIENKTMEGWVEKEKRDSIAKEEAKKIFEEKAKEVELEMWFWSVWRLINHHIVLVVPKRVVDRLHSANPIDP